MHCMGIYITTDLSEKHTFGSTDTEISITDIENQCAVSKWKILYCNIYFQYGTALSYWIFF